VDDSCIGHGCFTRFNDINENRVKNNIIFSICPIPHKLKVIHINILHVPIISSLTSIISYNLHHCLIEKNIINIISFTSLPRKLFYIPHEADLDHTTKDKMHTTYGNHGNIKNIQPRVENIGHG
jgi:hypothetical protein